MCIRDSIAYLVLVDFVEKSYDVRELFDLGDLDGGFVALCAAYVEQMIVCVNNQRLKPIHLIIHHHVQHVVIDPFLQIVTV